MVAQQVYRPAFRAPRGLPAEDLDVCVFSGLPDFLADSEIRATLRKAERCLGTERHIVFANEWSPLHQGLNSPAAVLEILDARSRWRRTHHGITPMDEDVALTIAVYRRV